MIRLRKGFKKFDYEQWSEQRKKEKMELYMKLSPEERLRIDTLNVELKQFGFSLDSSIDEVFEKYHKEELQNGKIQRLKYVQPDAYNNVLSLYLAELKEETKHKESNSTYDTVRVTAYDTTTFPHTEYHVQNPKLSELQLFLYEQHAKYPPTTTPLRHIELCLQAITRGVELAKFIPELEKEINDGKIKFDKELTYKNLPEIFIKPDYYEPCLNVLRQITPPAINKANAYIGNNKGVFPLWIKKLLEKELILNLPAIQYKDLLNKAITGLNLSKEASEFNKIYKRLETSDIPDDMDYFLSQIEK